jgi:hypothetical protein
VMDSSGTGVPARTAIAPEVIVGAMRFRDVSFEVLGGPFENAEVGIVGMPMQLSLGRIEWSTDGTIRVGAEAERSADGPNLLFFHHRLLVHVDVLGKTTLGVLDTGATGTDLNANLVDLLPESLMRDVKRGQQEITGAGGTQTFDSFEVPELVFSLGQARPFLRPAVVTLQRMPLMGGECCIGNIGQDLLTQGRGFSIDFSAMRLRVH